MKILRLLLLASGTVLVLFLWQGNKGLNLADEGYLWYGAQRVMAGEMPLRDFMAYDPGRYYWSAALMRLMGDNGIMALRSAVAIFQAMGLVIGLLLLVRSYEKPNRLFTMLAVITLAVWMFPRYKIFDISLSLALIGALSFLIERPTGRRYFLTGLIVGFAAVFGRNHGVYGLLGSLGVMVYMALGRENGSGFGLVPSFGIFTTGVVVGYFPMLLGIAAVPGFAPAYWESIAFLWKVLKGTNIPLPVPWPWRVMFGQGPMTIGMARSVLVGLFFMAMVVFGLLGIVWVIRQRLQKKSVSPVLVASVFLALPYAHYSYSRADIEHLALGIFPFLLGGLVLLANKPSKIKWSFAALLCGASLLVMIPMHPGWKCYASKQWVEMEVTGNALMVEPGTAADLVMLKKLAKQFAPDTRSFIATPFWPGAYAALKRKAPMWEIYAISPRGKAFEELEIERIKAANPGFAIVYDHALDGRDELRFGNTHPITDRYIRDHFEPVIGFTQNPEYRIYRSKGTAS